MLRILTLISIATTTMTNQTSATPLTKPWHEIEFITFNCGIEISINGHKVVSVTQIANHAADVPINHWIQTGDNTIEVKAYLRKQEPNVKYNITCGLTGLLSNHWKKPPKSNFFEKIDITPNSTSTKDWQITSNKTKEQIVAKRTFKVSAKLPAWSWLGADKIPDTEATKKSLEQEFTKLFNAYKANDRKKIIEIRSPQYEELGQAVFESKEEYAKGDMEKLDIWQEALGNLADLDFEGQRLVLSGNGRLATLWDEDDDTPILYYKNDEYVTIHAWYMRTKDGKWRLVR